MTWVDNDLALDIAPKLKHLKEVEGLFASSKFLQMIPTVLEVLNIPYWSCVDCKPDSIVRHGTRLRRLTLHSQPHSWINECLPRDEDLLEMANGLPHLEELAIDVAIDSKANDWPYSSLEIIAKFRSIRVIRIWFELGIGENSLTPTPALTAFVARQLFEYLHARNKNIQRLEVGPRDSSDRPATNILSEASLEVKRCRRFVCEVSTYDCNPAKIRVTSPDFSDEMSSELDRLVMENSEEKRALFNDSRDLFLKAALDGPLSSDEYSAWEQARNLANASTPRRSAKGIRKYIPRL
jgi:hypothetical protein